MMLNDVGDIERKKMTSLTFFYIKVVLIFMKMKNIFVFLAGK